MNSLIFLKSNQTISSWETGFKRTSEASNCTINVNIDYEINANKRIYIPRYNELNPFNIFNTQKFTQITKYLNQDVF